MAAPTASSQGGRARKLERGKVSRARPESAEEALKRLEKSTASTPLAKLPENATQNPRTPVKSSQPLPQNALPTEVLEKKAPSPEMLQQAQKDVKGFIQSFKRRGEFPGAALKNLCETVPQADRWFSEALEELKPQLSGFPLAFTSYTWMKSQVEGAVLEYLRDKKSPDATVKQWKEKAGSIAVDRVWAQKLNELCQPTSYSEKLAAKQSQSDLDA